MKKVLTIIAILCCNLAIAQNRTSNYVTKQGDKLILVKVDNTVGPVRETMKLADGNIITLDGKYTMPDGTSVMIQEGDEIHMDGRTYIKELDALKAAKKEATKK